MNIFNFINTCFSVEENKEFSSDENRRIRFVIYISLIGAVNLLLYAFLYSIIDFKHYLPAIIFYGLMGLATLGIIVVNRLGFYNLSKVLIVTLFPLYVAVNSTWLFGKAPGSHVFFLLFSLIPLFLWSIKKTGYLVFFIGLNLALYFLIEFFPAFIEPKFEISLFYLNFFKSTNVLISFLCIGVAIKVYQLQANKTEEQLIKQTVELEKSKQHQDMVYSVIAHDLRSPFNGLLGLSEIMLKNRDAFDREKSKTIISAIFSSASTLNTLLENLLDWSKMQTGKMEKETIAFEIAPLVDDVINLLADIIKTKELSVSNTIDAKTIVTADAYMIATVFRNLITNAVKFTPNKGIITIASKNINNVVEFCISDSGIGIAEEHINDIFNLQSVYVTHGTNYEKGSGLGLKLCRGFIEENDGTIWVLSEENKGSKFYFTLNN